MRAQQPQPNPGDDCAALHLSVCKASGELTQTFERIVCSVSHFLPLLPWHVLWGKDKHGLMSAPRGGVGWK